MDLSHLAPRRALFVLEYLKDLHGTKAAQRAGYAAASAHIEASRLLATPEVKAAVDEALAARANELKIEATDVLRELWRIASADPNDIVQYRRTCCRHCWGEGFGYQRTRGEMARDRAQHDREQERNRREAERANMTFEATAFNEAGGIGYDARREPHEDCPECFGEGLGEIFAKDTRLLASEARALYAGVKRTKDGIEIKTHDKKGALELVGRHLGMFTDRVEVTGKVELASAIVAARQRAAKGTSEGDVPGSDLL